MDERKIANKMMAEARQAARLGLIPALPDDKRRRVWREPLNQVRAACAHVHAGARRNNREGSRGGDGRNAGGYVECSARFDRPGICEGN